MSDAVREVAKRDSILEYAFEHGISMGSRRIVLSGDIDSQSFRFISTALTELEAISKQGITIEINSDGGEVYEALAIVGRIKSSPCQITTVGYGRIMSAAVAILAAGDKRLMSKYAWVMVHQGSSKVTGRTSELLDYALQCRREEQQWAELMQDLTSTPVQTWHAMNNKDTYLTPNEALQLGIVDKLI